MVKVARLQSEVRTRDCLSYEFAFEKCSENIPEYFTPSSLWVRIRRGIGVGVKGVAGSDAIVVQ